jgi:nitrate reductase alpha subunit
MKSDGEHISALDIGLRQLRCNLEIRKRVSMATAAEQEQCAKVMRVHVGTINTNGLHQATKTHMMMMIIISQSCRHQSAFDGQVHDVRLNALC